MRKFLSIFLFSIIYCSSYGQVPSNGMNRFFQGYETYYPGIIAEFQALKHQSVSVGFSVMHLSEHSDLLGRGFAFNNEFVFKNAYGNFVYSPQLSVYCSFIFLYVGTKFSYYTDFKNGGIFQFTPEVGLGYQMVFLVYSRNISLTNNDMVSVNKNNLSIKALIPLELIFNIF